MYALLFTKCILTPEYLLHSALNHGCSSSLPYCVEWSRHETSRFTLKTAG